MIEFVLQDVLEKFWASGQDEPLVIYDVDDLLWSLMRVVCAAGRIDFRVATEVFSIRENPSLTKAEQDFIIAAFADAKMFENIKFFPGAADIMRPCELGARVGIKTNSFTQEVASTKTVQLLAHIHGLRPEHISDNIIGYGDARRKPLDPHTTILIEDSPHNVSQSPALVNLMPLYIGWTHSPSSQVLLQDKCVVYKQDLIGINNFVYNLVELMMRR